MTLIQDMYKQFSRWLQVHGGVFASLFAGVVFFLPYERIVTLELAFIPGGYTLRLSHLFAGLMIVGFMMSLIKNRRKISLQSWDYLLAAFLFSYLLSALLAQDLKRALVVWLFTVFVSLTAFVISEVVRPEWSKYIEPVLATTTWIVLAFGFYQYLGDSVGLSTDLTGLRDLYTRTAIGFPRIQSFGLEPLYYASFLQIPLYYYVVQYVFGEKKRPWLLLAIITQIILTVSRGAVIAVTFAMLVFLASLIVMRWKKTVWVNVAKLFGIVGVGILSSYLLILASGQLTKLTEKPDSAGAQEAKNRVESTFRQTTNLEEQDDRARNRILAISAWKQNPILGIGPGNFGAFAVQEFPAYSGSSGYIIVNNEPLELLSEAGLVGFTLFLTLILVLVYYAVRLILKDKKLKQSTSLIAISGILYLIALAVQYQTFSTLYIMHIWFVIGMMMYIARHAKHH